MDQVSNDSLKFKNSIMESINFDMDNDLNTEDKHI